MSYSFKFVRVINGKTTEETYPDNQSAHAAMGLYAGQHDLNVQCIKGRFLELSKSIMYKGDDPLLGVCGYVCWDVKEHRGRINDIEKPSNTKPKPKIRKKRSL
jgi:hypothetical protein